MYLYAFNLYAGSDRVFKYDSIATKLNFSEGDLIQIQEQYFLVLGEELSFQEQYSSVPLMSGIAQLVHKFFLSNKAMQLMHWMTYQRYSSYKSVMKCFLPKDITILLKKIVKTKKSKYIAHQLTILDQKYAISELGQTLIIFPDLWTLYNTIPKEFLLEKNNVVLCSSSTQNQKDRAWWGMKSGTLQILLSTHAQVFQDFCDLKKIIQIAPHKRYYANQQDPRYKTGEVVKKIKKIWKIE